MPVKFEVLGVPVGKSRPKFSTVNGHAVAYTPTKTANYETLVKLAYQQQCGGKVYDKDIQLRAEIMAYFPIPKSDSKVKREGKLSGKIRPTKKPDSDNIAKCVLDALNGIAYHDDSQICELLVRKYYSDQPRAEVTIHEIVPHDMFG